MKCAVCRDEGMIRNTQGIPIPCECVKRRRLIAIYQEVGLPLRFVDATLDQFSIKQDAHGKDLDKKSEKQKIIARNVVAAFIEHLPNIFTGLPFTFEVEDNGNRHALSSYSLILRGNAHSGKSLLAACIAKGALDKSILPKYLEWSEVIGACFDYHSDASVKNMDKIDKYTELSNIIKSNKLLIIDNLDSSYEKNISKYDEDDKLTANVRRQLDSMFSVRSKKTVPTVFTTNQPFSDLLSEKKYGPVLLSILDDAVKVELPTLGRSNDKIEMKKVN